MSADGDMKRQCRRQQPAQVGAVDIEAFAKNIARMVEEGGKALAAYMKPREEGQRQGRAVRRNHRRGQDARPGRRILAVRSAARASNCSRGLGKRLSRSVGRRGQAHGRRRGPAGGRSPIRGTSASPIRNGRPTSSSISSSRPICSPRNGPTSWSRTPQGLDPHTRQKAEFYVQADRQRDLAVELRADQSGAAARDARLQRRKPRARHAHAGRGHRGRRRRSEDPPVRRLEVRGRPQSRAHARQGDLRERADAAHPIRADDREGAQDARC